MICHEFIDGIEHKRCTRCGLLQPLLHFPTNRSNSDELHGTCRSCCAEAGERRARLERLKQLGTLKRVGRGSVREWAVRSSPLRFEEATD